MAVYHGNAPYVFVSYAHSDSSIVLPIIEHMQQSGIRVWYDDGIEAGSEWPQYIAENLEKASCVLVFMSPNSANSHNCRNEINLASELKKEFLVVHLVDFELALGLRLQLNSYQAIFRSKFKTDSEFVDALAAAKILRKYRDGNDEDVVRPTQTAPPAKTRKKRKTVWLALGGAALLTLCLTATICFAGSKITQWLTHPAGTSTDTPASDQEAAIIDYEGFYDNLIAASERLGCDALWTPSDLIDNYRLDQGDGDVWVTYYTNSFQQENVSLHLAFRNEDAEIMAILNSFKEEDLDAAHLLLECLSSAVSGYCFTDFNELLVNEDRDPWKPLDEPRSIWNDVLELEERAFSQVDENTEITTHYKTLALDDLVIYVERRCRVYHGERYYDFTVLYEHADSMAAEE